MSTPRELNRLFPVKYEHRQIVSVAAGDKFTLDFVGNDTDTASDKHFNLGYLGAVMVYILTSADIKITKINNKALIDPIPFDVKFVDRYASWQSCEIQAEAAATIINIYVHGGYV